MGLVLRLKNLFRIATLAATMDAAALPGAEPLVASANTAPPGAAQTSFIDESSPGKDLTDEQILDITERLMLKATA